MNISSLLTDLYLDNNDYHYHCQAIFEIFISTLKTRRSEQVKVQGQYLIEQMSYYADIQGLKQGRAFMNRVVFYSFLYWKRD